jgi:hypothetical protein
MRRSISFLALAALMLLNVAESYCEYDKFDIKYGMHERIVNQKYGDPIYVKNIKLHPIPHKKALYGLDESDYMILYYFSGRIYKIVLLERMDAEQATEIFEED